MGSTAITGLLEFQALFFTEELLFPLSRSLHTIVYLYYPVNIVICIMFMKRLAKTCPNFPMTLLSNIPMGQNEAILLVFLKKPIF